VWEEAKRKTGRIPIIVKIPTEEILVLVDSRRKGLHGHLHDFE